MSLGTIILLVITIIVVCIGGISLVIGKINYDVPVEIVGIKILFAGFFCFCIFLLSIPASKISDGMKEHEAMISTIEENADDWTFYLDGEEVSFDNINIRQYQVSYEVETRKVFLTKKADQKNTFMPIFLPL